MAVWRGRLVFKWFGHLTSSRQVMSILQIRTPASPGGASLGFTPEVLFIFSRKRSSRASLRLRPLRHASSGKLQARYVPIVFHPVVKHIPRASSRVPGTTCTATNGPPMMPRRSPWRGATCAAPATSSPASIAKRGRTNSSPRTYVPFWLPSGPSSWGTVLSSNLRLTPDSCHLPLS